MSINNIYLLIIFIIICISYLCIRIMVQKRYSGNEEYDDEEDIEESVERSSVKDDKEMERDQEIEEEENREA